MPRSAADLVGEEAGDEKGDGEDTDEGDSQFLGNGRWGGGVGRGDLGGRGGRGDLVERS